MDRVWPVDRDWTMGVGRHCPDRSCPRNRLDHRSATSPKATRALNAPEPPQGRQCRPGRRAARRLTPCHRGRRAPHLAKFRGFWRLTGHRRVPLPRGSLALPRRPSWVHLGSTPLDAPGAIDPKIAIDPLVTRLLCRVGLGRFQRGFIIQEIKYKVTITMVGFFWSSESPTSALPISGGVWRLRCVLPGLGILLTDLAPLPSGSALGGPQRHRESPSRPNWLPSPRSMACSGVSAMPFQPGARHDAPVGWISLPDNLALVCRLGCRDRILALRGNLDTGGLTTTGHRSANRRTLCGTGRHKGGQCPHFGNHRRCWPQSRRWTQ